MDAKQLTEMAFAKSGETSIRAFAGRVGVSHVTVLAWLDGTRHPSFEHAAELAALAQLPIIKTASEVRLHSPDNAKHKDILRRLAAAALTVLLGIGITLPGSAQAAELAQHAVHNDHALYIMRNCVSGRCSPPCL
jgi:transcriptional regulator with XRE-family HTH domain